MENVVYTKASDMKFEDFLARFKEVYPDAWEKAISLGATEEKLVDLVKSNYNSYGHFKVDRVINKIRRDMDFYMSEKISGCLIGSIDKYEGSLKAPIRYLLLKQDKNHIELSNFGRKTTYAGKSDFTIPVPSLVTVRAEFDDTYNTYNLLSIEMIQKDHIDHAGLLKVCERVEIPVRQITKEMAWSRGKKATPVVIRGRINAFFPAVVFTDEEEIEKRTIKDTYPIYVEDGEGNKQPCFNIKLAGTGGKYVRCHVRRQRYGRPTIVIPDLEDTCRMIVEKVDDPNEQARQLSMWFRDTEVFVAGTITSYKDTIDNNGNAITNIEINAYAIIEIPDDRLRTDLLQTTFEAEEKIPKFTEQKPLGAQPSGKIAEVVNDLKVFCEAADISPDKLSLDVIKSQALDRFNDIPDGVLIEAIKVIRDGK